MNDATTPPPRTPRPAGLPLALEGIRVVDFSRVLAGPFGTQMLADLGADVIKIENPRGGDDARASLPRIGTESVFLLSCNRNKRSLALDFTKPEGREIALRLIADADILVENFTSGVMPRYGLDYATLAEMFPRLIYLSVSGYGRTGSHADAAGLDPIVAAETGVAWMTGPPDERPQFNAITLVDVATAMNAQFAVMAALFARERLGRGQHVDISLYDTAITALSFVGAKYFATGEEPPRNPRIAHHRVPTGEFDCADRSLYLICFTDRHFADLCNKVFDRPDLATDPRHATAALRSQNAGPLVSTIIEIFRTDTAENWVGKMKAIGVPGGVLRTPGEALTSEFTLERNMVSSIAHPTLGSVFNIESSFQHLSLTPAVEPVAAPLLGQHTRRILSDDLGYDDEGIERLRAEGVIGITDIDR